MEALPYNPAARNLLAVACFQAGNFEHAAFIYESLEQEFPLSVAAKVNHGLVRLRLGDAMFARDLLEQAVAMDPSQRRAWGYLGVALEQLGQIDEAEHALLAGHHASAAHGLRLRHQSEDLATPQGIPEADPDATRRAMPLLTYRRKTLPPDPWMRSVAGGVTEVGTQSGPPSACEGSQADAGPLADSWPPPTTPPTDPIEEIAFGATVSPLPPPPGMGSSPPKQSRAALPVLDAALSALIVTPHEASAIAHPTGLVLVGLIEGEARDGGFAANMECLLATAGSLRRESMPKRGTRIVSLKGSDGAFVRITGTGQLVLRPPPGHRLWHVQMDADVAFFREELVVAFDLGLLSDLRYFRQPLGGAVTLARFRGDGTVVLKLDQPFIALDVRAEERVRLRTDMLLGWIGLLSPEPTDVSGDGHDDFTTFTGEGTVLLRAPRES